MKLIAAGWMMMLLLGEAVAFADAGAPVAAVTSTKERGVVSVQADPELADGRLVLKVVAFNRTKEPVSFGPENVAISTAAGQAVALLSLEQLVKEARGAGGRSARVEHDPASYSGAAVSHNAAGQPDVGTYTGSNTQASGGVTSQTAAATATHSGAPESALQQQIASLEAAVLHPLTIAPGAAGGGQVVTEKLKLKRKDDRTLLVAVDFNGERHDIKLVAPR